MIQVAALISAGVKLFMSLNIILGRATTESFLQKTNHSFSLISHKGIERNKKIKTGTNKMQKIKGKRLSIIQPSTQNYSKSSGKLKVIISDS